MATDGERILKLGLEHVGEKYVLGAAVPKNNADWTGPWDCAEFASWLVYQVAEKLYGCDKDQGDPASADAYSGYWGRDAKKLGIRIPVEQAARTPGAAVVRLPKANAVGHVVISDGKGGTVEAHSTKRGVITSTLSARRWDLAVLVPGLEYVERKQVPVVSPPKTVIYRLRKPHMKDDTVEALQRSLQEAGFHPGDIDGDFGTMTQAAVIAFQAAKALVPDGEIGPATARALGVKLPASGN